MRVQKGIKTRRSYDADFKQEVTRLLASGRSAKEISEAFGIAEKWFATSASIIVGREWQL